MTITLNGEKIELTVGTTLARLAADRGWVVGRMACERNGSIVRRADYGQCVLTDGDVVEAVQMIGGG